MASSNVSTIAYCLDFRRGVLYVIGFSSLSILLMLLSVKFSLSGPTAAVIVLSQLERRFYRDISGRASWTMDFCLVKEGEEDTIAESAHSDFYQRSVHLEVDLDKGTYIVYVRLDRTLDRNEVCDMYTQTAFRFWQNCRGSMWLMSGNSGNCRGYWLNVQRASPLLRVRIWYLHIKCITADLDF